MSFKDLLKKNLTNNGFPNKKVSFGLERLYELADKAGESLNDILESLEDENITHEKTDEKIIFKSSKEINSEAINPDMMKQAQEMMENMDPSELKRIKDMMDNMSEEEKARMMEEAKKMGMI